MAFYCSPSVNTVPRAQQLWEYFIVLIIFMHPGPCFMGPDVGTIPKFQLHISRHCQIESRLIYYQILIEMTFISFILHFYFTSGWLDLIWVLAEWMNLPCIQISGSSIHFSFFNFNFSHLFHHLKTSLLSNYCAHVKCSVAGLNAALKAAKYGE